MMHAVAFPSQPAKPVISCGSWDLDETERMGRSAVWALLEEIKAHEPSRGELIQVIGATCGGALNDVACTRLADAVIALWKR